jgi:hypothetical protein
MTEKLVFALVLPASLLFTVGTLHIYRRWLEMAGYDQPETASRPGWALGLAFGLMLAGGITAFIFGASRFVSVSLTVCSLVGLCSLVDLMFNFYGGRLSGEMRKVIADDL